MSIQLEKLTHQDLIENFDLFDDWEDRYRYLIELGDSLPSMDGDLKVECNVIQGCLSQVWIKMNKDTDGNVVFTADSDASIVRGLIAVLWIVFFGRPVENIKKIDIKEIFEDMGLEQHLSVNRRNGFYAMVQKIQGFQ